MTLAGLEQRVARIERELRLKPKRTSGKWWIDSAGRFENDPVFEEMVRLGREYRESLRPKPRKRKKARRDRSRH